MLVICIVSTVVWLAMVPQTSLDEKSNHALRMTAFIFILCAFLGLSDLYQGFETLEIYHSLFYGSFFSLIMDAVLYVTGLLVLICFSPRNVYTFSGKKLYQENETTLEALQSTKSDHQITVKPEYGLILMFSVVGASIIISAQDLISIYVALELQSFGLYLLACLRTDEIESTHASLKYFLLGAMSSAFVLLGISLIYQEVGSTAFQNISTFIISIRDQALMDTVTSSHDEGQGLQSSIYLGLLSLLCGLIFKISAAPFHSWFSDVIQGVPTSTSMVIINLPKISIFTFLYVVLHFVVCQETGLSEDSWIADSKGPELFLMITTLFSLVIGTVAGLMQTKIKRLLAFSTISHVGFILISLCAGSEASLSAIIFYLMQYTLTVVLTFLVLTAYENGLRRQVNYIVDLQGFGSSKKLLSFTFVVCLFSMAGIPPLTGFYAKLEVLNSSLIQNISMIYITAIVCSVISAAYYFKVIKVLMFDMKQEPALETQGACIPWDISPVHSYTIALLTAFICLFLLDPQCILNCTELVALSLYLV